MSVSKQSEQIAQPLASSREAVSPPRAMLSTVAASLGNVLEWYDFGIYGYFATLIAHRFFADGDPASALLSSFAVFGVGFVVRPLGGIAIGRFGDRRGRKPALMLTMGLMATGTLMIALIPSYAEIGILSPLLLLVARLVQGFSAGGEWGTASSFLVEWAPSGKRGFYGSFQQSTVMLGLLLGALVSALVTSILSAQDVETWGWRIPFFLGGLLGPIGLYVRRSVSETPAFKQQSVEREQGTARKNLWRPATRLFAIVAMPYAVTLTFLLYYPTFTQKYVGLSRAESLWSNSVALLVLIVLIPVAGAISDRIGRKPMLIAGNTAFLLFSYPMLSVTLGHGNLFTVMAVQTGFAVFYATYTGSGVAAYAELFPTHSRMLWLSVAYNLSGIVFGAFAGYIATWLIGRTGTPMSIICLVLVSTVVTGIGLVGMRETAHGPLR
jgi:MHS family proline/betaine transporter-like MFS transporter